MHTRRIRNWEAVRSGARITVKGDVEGDSRDGKVSVNVIAPRDGKVIATVYKPLEIGVSTTERQIDEEFELVV